MQQRGQVIREAWQVKRCRPGCQFSHQTPFDG
jgi:hypothetical protein